MMHTLLSVVSADQPECMTCQCPLTVKHIPVECTDLNDTRNKYLVASSTEELFRSGLLILSKKKTIFTTSYNVVKYFYSRVLSNSYVVTFNTVSKLY